MEDRPANQSKHDTEVLMKRKRLFELITKGGEYEVQVVAKALCVKNPYEDGDVSEYEAIDTMRVQCAAKLVNLPGEGIKNSYRWVCDNGYLIM